MYLSQLLLQISRRLPLQTWWRVLVPLVRLASKLGLPEHSDERSCSVVFRQSTTSWRAARPGLTLELCFHNLRSEPIMIARCRCSFHPAVVCAHLAGRDVLSC